MGMFWHVLHWVVVLGSRERLTDIPSGPILFLPFECISCISVGCVDTSAQPGWSMKHVITPKRSILPDIWCVRTSVRRGAISGHLRFGSFYVMLCPMIWVSFDNWLLKSNTVSFLIGLMKNDRSSGQNRRYPEWRTMPRVAHWLEPSCLVSE